MHKLLDIIHKPPLLTVRTVLIAIMTLFVTLSSHAQEGLAVNSIFQQYGHSKGCKMVVMQNTKLRGYRLAVYKSLTYNNKYATSINNILKTFTLWQAREISAAHLGTAPTSTTK